MNDVIGNDNNNNNNNNNKWKDEELNKKIYCPIFKRGRHEDLIPGYGSQQFFSSDPEKILEYKKSNCTSIEYFIKNKPISYKQIPNPIPKEDLEKGKKSFSKLDENNKKPDIVIDTIIETSSEPPPPPPPMDQKLRNNFGIQLQLDDSDSSSSSSSSSSSNEEKGNDKEDINKNSNPNVNKVIRKRKNSNTIKNKGSSYSNEDSISIGCSDDDGEDDELSDSIIKQMMEEDDKMDKKQGYKFVNIDEEEKSNYSSNEDDLTETSIHKKITKDEELLKKERAERKHRAYREKYDARTIALRFSDSDDDESYHNKDDEDDEDDNSIKSYSIDSDSNNTDNEEEEEEKPLKKKNKKKTIEPEIKEIEIEDSSSKEEVVEEVNTLDILEKEDEIKTKEPIEGFREMIEQFNNLIDIEKYYIPLLSELSFMPLLENIVHDMKDALIVHVRNISAYLALECYARRSPSYIKKIMNQYGIDNIIAPPLEYLKKDVHPSELSITPDDSLPKGVTTNNTKSNKQQKNTMDRYMKINSNSNNNNVIIPSIVGQTKQLITSTNTIDKIPIQKPWVLSMKDREIFFKKTENDMFKSFKTNKNLHIDNHPEVIAEIGSVFRNLEPTDIEKGYGFTISKLNQFIYSSSSSSSTLIYTSIDNNRDKLQNIKTIFLLSSRNLYFSSFIRKKILRHKNENRKKICCVTGQEIDKEQLFSEYKLILNDRDRAIDWKNERVPLNPYKEESLLKSVRIFFVLNSFVFKNHPFYIDELYNPASQSTESSKNKSEPLISESNNNNNNNTTTKSVDNNMEQSSSTQVMLFKKDIVNTKPKSKNGSNKQKETTTTPEMEVEENKKPKKTRKRKSPDEGDKIEGSSPKKQPVKRQRKNNNNNDGDKNIQSVITTPVTTTTTITKTTKQKKTSDQPLLNEEKPVNNKKSKSQKSSAPTNNSIPVIISIPSYVNSSNSSSSSNNNNNNNIQNDGDEFESLLNMIGNNDDSPSSINKDSSINPNGREIIDPSISLQCNILELDDQLPSGYILMVHPMWQAFHIITSFIEMHPYIQLIIPKFQLLYKELDFSLPLGDKQAMSRIFTKYFDICKSKGDKRPLLEKLIYFVTSLFVLKSREELVQIDGWLQKRVFFQHLVDMSPRDLNTSKTNGFLQNILDISKDIKKVPEKLGYNNPFLTIFQKRNGDVISVNENKKKNNNNNDEINSSQQKTTTLLDNNAWYYINNLHNIDIMKEHAIFFILFFKYLFPVSYSSMRSPATMSNTDIDDRNKQIRNNLTKGWKSEEHINIMVALGRMNLFQKDI